jgi:hypothetical protein
MARTFAVHELAITCDLGDVYSDVYTEMYGALCGAMRLGCRRTLLIGSTAVAHITGPTSRAKPVPYTLVVSQGFLLEDMRWE